MADKFYITTPIFYVNSKPHIGHAFTMIASDVVARYHRNLGHDTFFLTGTDEHGAKIAQAAENVGKTPEEFTDEISETFRIAGHALNISNTEFIRTTDKEKHLPGVLKVWNALVEQGDIYKGTYEGLYCIGHEAFLKKSDLTEDGRCPDHLTAPESLKEENYFFRLSKYIHQLQELYQQGKIAIFPESRTKEVLNMLKELEDVSFSRPRNVVKWGIPVPGDDTQLIYVWADALTNYISALGYGRNNEWQQWWPADVQMIGKDILKFHAITWPAMLLALGLNTPKALYVHGYITVDGQKMSKTIGNVIDPIMLVEKYGVDPVRYFLMREISSSEDGDFSFKKLEDRYNSDLANNLGNLVSRTAKLIETKLEGELMYNQQYMSPEVAEKIEEAQKAYRDAIGKFRLHEALGATWDLLAFANKYIDEHKPWTEQPPEHLLTTLTSVTVLIIEATTLIQPFMPDTAKKIFATFGVNDQHQDVRELKCIVTQQPSLFPRLQP